ncbi:hypothetical protein [Thalassomonas haliotis]|nr:hypothetical protein [Thalassomonas haliotis]
MKDDNKEAEDAFIRGYHDIPSDKELGEMSDVSLAELLQGL